MGPWQDRPRLLGCGWHAKAPVHIGRVLCPGSPSPHEAVFITEPDVLPFFFFFFLPYYRNHPSPTTQTRTSLGVCAGSCRRPLPLTCHLAPAGSPGGAQSSSTNPSSRRLSVRIQLPLPCRAGTPRAVPMVNPVGISSGPGENSTDYILVSLVGSVLESWGQKDLKGTWPHPAICVDPLSPEAPWGLDSFPHPGSGGFIST